MCIPLKWRCDQDDDCGDNGDEIDCERPTCKEYEFSCGTGLCIPSDWVCDGDFDCKDNSDEAECSRVECEGEDLFRCNNDHCIRSAFVCDGDNDCKDGSDETCMTVCNEGEFTCDGGGCIDEAWKCDGDRDCSDGSDEKNCSHHDTGDCTQGQFTCNTGQCILMHYMCDGERDCDDNSDEDHCANITCRDNEFLCANNVCITAQWYCDGDYDCEDQSDEQNCPVTTCLSNQFQCASGRCITAAWECDGENDCGDNSDEESCRPTLCNVNQFKCNNNRCVGNRKVCNGRDDCGDGSDELIEPDGPCNIIDPFSSCGSDNGGCEHTCTDVSSGVRCSCREGYTLDINGKTCRDINECLVEGICSQVCTNTRGSFLCSCVEGYELRLDGKTCKAQGPEPYLLFANRIDIRRLEPLHSSYTPILRGLENAIALDYHIEQQLVFWSDVSLDSIKRAYLNGTDVMDVVSTGLESPGGVAVDWIGNKLFWSDSGTSKIEVSHLDGSSRSVLIWEGLEKPRALALHPVKGMIYWTDWGSLPKIERANMDGSGRQVIADTTLFWPNGLTLDYATEKLFWADAKHHSIESANLDGSGRKIVINQGLPHPFAITLFEDYIYWTDWHTKSINTANKFTGTDLTIIQGQLHFPMDIHTFHPQRQPNGSNLCLMSSCSHLCLQRGTVDITCGCPTGFKLINRTHCAETIDSYLLFSRETDIRRISFDTDDGSDVVLPLSGLKQAVALDWDDVEGGFVYWGDVSTNKINRARWNGSDQEVILSNNMDSPAGLAIDWITSKIYWTEATNNRIEVANVDGSMRSVLIWEDLDRPRDIIVDPISSLMYWTDWGSDPKIERSSMDGSERRVLVSYGLFWPNGLVLDRDEQRLYWADAGTKRIEFTSLDGSYREILISLNVPHPFGLAIHNDQIYWTDWETKSVERANKMTGLNRETVRAGLEDLMDIKVFHHNRPTRTGPCDVNNGGCSHLCLLSSSPEGFTCACPTGIMLGDDGFTCNQDLDKFLVFAHKTDVRIVSLETQYAVDVVSPIDEITNAVAVDVDTVQRKLYWADKVTHTIMRSSLNGSDVETVLDTCLDTVEGITVDSGGQKLYWTDAGRKRIEVADVNGSNRKVLVWRDLEEPRGIALHTKRRLMFWSDWGSRPRIERSAMDGTRRQAIVTSNLEWPNGVCVDQTIDRIFWVDARTERVESCALDGSSRRLLVYDGVSHPYGLTVLDDYIYWTDWDTGAIHRAEKQDGGGAIDILGNFDSLMDIKAVNMQDKGENVCGSDNGGCSHLCLPNPQGYSCACPTGIIINQDNRTCPDVPSTFLLFANSRSIRRISMDTPDHTDVSLPFENLGNAVALDFDSIDRKIYFTDVLSDIIGRADYDGRNMEVIVSEGLETTDGIAVDWIGRNMFWTDAGYNHIAVARLDGSSRKVVVSSGLHEPRAIALFPSSGYMFWSDWGNHPKIERAHFDGTGRRTLINTDLGWPNGLTIDYAMRRLYWVDAYLDKIETADFSGKFRVVLTSNVTTHSFGLTMFGSRLFWTDWQTNTIETVEKTTGRDVVTFQNNLDSLMHIQMVSPLRQTGTNPCGVDNGGCSHLCLARPQGYVCACPDEPDGRTCSLTPGAIDVNETPKPSPSSTTTKHQPGPVITQPPRPGGTDKPPKGPVEITLDPGNGDPWKILTTVKPTKTNLLGAPHGCSEEEEALGLCDNGVQASNKNGYRILYTYIVVGVLAFLIVAVLLMLVILWRRSRRRRRRCRLDSRSNFYNPRYNHMTNEVMIEPRITRAWISYSTPVSREHSHSSSGSLPNKVNNEELDKMLPPPVPFGAMSSCQVPCAVPYGAAAPYGATAPCYYDPRPCERPKNVNLDSCGSGAFSSFRDFKITENKLQKFTDNNCE
ncbi:low-density lipoprotein receptor-related protein 4-like [Lytechinus variegatus]|uniref:low-density lipoprotein receptor-related protein 4-like n=1 Tax=Lytechinus variegatus TaxID=7654 RepID=UPI001BB131C1|nr:low-density lipoprotein receptor-related protein 4-like [Lytechinus variegatus]